MKDPYAVLGTAKTATADDIKKAYRKLAKQHHPDLNPGSAEAAAKFKDISAAYDLLSDADKRARFDRGEIDASGQERADSSFYRAHAGGPQGAKYRSGAGFDASDLFSELFRRGGGGGDGGGFDEFRMRGGDVSYALTVDFVEAAKGTTKRLTFPDGKALDVNVPPGTESGQVLRLRGRGQAGSGGGTAGDALIEITVEDHPFFRRSGNDITVELPVTLTEAVEGGKITVPTIDGPVSMNVPAGSNTGSKLRLRGKGVASRGDARGDQYVMLKVVLPKASDPALAAFVKDWTGRDYDVRGPGGDGDMSALDHMATEYGIAVEELAIWVERRWVLPASGGGDFHFTDADRARLRMIVEFRRDLAIDDETMPMVLALVDRLHAARAELRVVLDAVAALPREEQGMVLRHLTREDRP